MPHKSGPFVELSVVLIAFLLFVGCEGQGGFNNTAPSELVLTADKCNVRTNGTVGLVGSATDGDDDSLSFSWKATAGTFTPASATGQSVAWTAPAGTGPVTITMTVTDGIDKRSKTHEVLVCAQMPTVVTTPRTIANTGDTYILTNVDPLRIPAGVTLTIEAGVEILVESPSGGFEVYGNLVAVGTPASRITITGSGCSHKSGEWAGIYLEGNLCAATLRNADILWGKDGVTVEAGARALLDSCGIFNHSDVGVSVLDGSTASIEGSKLWENGGGLDVRNSEATVSNSSIRYNLGTGVELDVSVDASARQAEITNSVIANSGANGIMIAERAKPEIHNCSIFSNGETYAGSYAIRLISYSAVDTIHAEGNFWGVGNTTDAAIRALIYDREDDEIANKAYVGFSPWLPAAPVAAKAR